MTNNILNRKIITKIKEFIDDGEIIVLHGARQVGKTSILHYLMQNILAGKTVEKNIVYFDLEDFALLELCNEGVDEVVDYLKKINCDFEKKIFLLIDEIQYLSDPSSFLKLLHDRHKGKIKLIVSGSSSFEIKSKFRNSLVGRIINFEIFPLDFEEYLWFKGENIDISGELPLILEDKLKKLYKEYAIAGGYPAIALENSSEKKETKLKQIINTYIKKDIRDLADIRNIDKFNDLTRLLAAQSGNLLNVSEISNSLGIAKATVNDYLFLLENTYIIKLLKPYHKNIRSELSKMPKIFFEDNGLANLLAKKALPEVLSGPEFESSVYMQLRKNYDSDELYFWRTNVGQEVDFILDAKKMQAMEVKMKYSDKNMKNLLSFGAGYDIKELFCVTLEKDKNSKLPMIKQIYPWEINNR